MTLPCDRPCILDAFPPAYLPSTAKNCLLNECRGRPQEANGLKEKGNVHFKAGEYPAAIEQYKLALKA